MPSRRLFCFAALVLTLTLSATALAFAAGRLSGVVTGMDGKPVANANVRISGQNITLTRNTDSQGRFAFSTLAVGQYTVEADHAGLHAVRVVELTDAAIHVTLPLAPLRVIGNVAVTRANSATRSGTDTTLTSMYFTRSPAGRSLTDTFAALPAAARGSNGQVHVNGDHNGL
ncbi:MAG: carboxypeptidase regulatory-like domain-containing protein, partial [Candidatus Eremiobacteraeota bacterium]|nr:carboxypeptidase regulatory-like domain-containing protein [Candidatus Eremiobacteraeota bacterium]